MSRIWQALFLMAAVLFFSGCSINHHVAKDYDQYLVKNTGNGNLGAARGNYESYRIAPKTKTHRYEFRSAMSGIGNLWIVEFGQILDSTLQSQDVQAAFDGLDKTDDADNRGSVLVFELDDYEFADFTAQVSMRVTLLTDGNEKFSRAYTSTGNSQGGKMFWGGVFATKNAVHQSTKGALDQIMRSLISDLNKR